MQLTFIQANLNLTVEKCYGGGHHIRDLAMDSNSRASSQFMGRGKPWVITADSSASTGAFFVIASSTSEFNMEKRFINHHEIDFNIISGTT